MGSVDVNWSKAGAKSYANTGVALIRESEAGVTLGMFRVGDKTSPAEYRSLAAACVQLAEYAEQCAVASETAKAEAGKLDKATVERVRTALKDQKPAERLALVISLAVAGLTVNLPEFGYDATTGKAVAEKSPTPPATGNAAADKILAGVGK
jgi:hypothetical protein